MIRRLMKKKTLEEECNIIEIITVLLFVKKLSLPILLFYLL